MPEMHAKLEQFQNPLTAKGAKILRKERKVLTILTLRTHPELVEGCYTLRTLRLRISTFLINISQIVLNCSPDRHFQRFRTADDHLDICWKRHNRSLCSFKLICI